MRKRGEFGTGPAPSAEEVVGSVAGQAEELFRGHLRDVDRKVPAQAPTGSDLVNEVGLAVEATWGKEYFQPVQFNGIDVGPLTARTVVRPGETSAAAALRLHRELAAVAEKIRSEKIASYLDALRDMHEGDGRRR